MAQERNPLGAPRRKALLDVRIALLLAVGIASLASCDAGTPGVEGPREETPTVGDGDVADPAVPSFRFQLADRELVTTAAGGLGQRERTTAVGAADTVRSLLTDLYAAAFLDPENWGAGDYAEVFGVFSGGAAAAARTRAAALTAGADAAGRFDRIEPIGGRLAIRVLVDRAGSPTLVASIVSFRARAFGADPTLIRSEGDFLFRRVGGAWRIVSFQVERADRRIEAA